MSDSFYTKQERQFIVLLRILGVVFFGVALIMAFYPNGIVEYVTRIGQTVFNWNEPALTQIKDYELLVLVIAALFTISYLSFESQANRLRNIDTAKSIIIFSFLAAVGFVASLLLTLNRFIYFIGALSSLITFTLTFYYYNAATRSRSK